MDTMNSRITPAEAAMLMPFATPRRTADAERIQAIVAEARRARDAALAERFLGFFHGLRAALTALRSRRETIEELRALSARQLTDIGVAPGNIATAAAQATTLAANDMAGTRQAA
jgi:uncharacterized protein YjiS (DUF1127 family)